MWLNDTKDLSGGRATFQLQAPKPTGRILTITAFVLDGDEVYVGDPGKTPWVGARRLVYQCKTGEGGKTTARTTCTFKTPAQLAIEAINK